MKAVANPSRKGKILNLWKQVEADDDMFLKYQLHSMGCGKMRRFLDVLTETPLFVVGNPNIGWQHQYSNSPVVQLYTGWLVIHGFPRDSADSPNGS